MGAIKEGLITMGMDFDGLEDKLNMKVGLEKLMSTKEEFKGYIEWRAEIQWHYFVQLLELGFTEDQAVQLIKGLFKNFGD